MSWLPLALVLRASLALSAGFAVLLYRTVFASGRLQAPGVGAG